MTDPPDGTPGAATADHRALTARLVVPDMDCPSCARKVDSSLERVDGVVEASPLPTSGTVTVTYDPDRTTEADLVDAVTAAGYEVLEDDPTAGDESDDDGVDVAPPTDVWTSPRAKKTWLGAGFLVAGLLIELLLPGANVRVAGVLGAALSVADVLFVAAAVASGVPIVRGGYYSARNLSLDIDLLMGTAVIAATAIGFFVEAATLAVLFSIAELLEDYAMDRARDSLRELMALSPDEATVIRDGTETTVDAADVAVGETVVVRPGEKIPLDGTVRTGDSAVDESPITGESVPVDKSPGDEVFAGSITEAGYLEVEVTSDAGHSTLSRIIEMVRGAEAEQTETEQFVDRFAGYYTPIVVAFAILTAAIPPLVIASSFTVDVVGYPVVFAGDWGTWFVRGLTLLVIACPCAFVISTPVSVVSGITSAAKNGVLVKGGTHLETMGAVDAVALDKTGTLTRGELAVTDVVALGDGTENDVLRLAAALERRSEHPIADAILARAREAGIDGLDEPANFEAHTGEGISAEVDGETYYAGKPALFGRLGFDHAATDGGISTGADAGTAALPADLLASLEAEGKTVVLVGTADELVGVLAIADEVRPGAARAVERLQELGVSRVVMLTGDNQGTARAIAEQVGVDDYRADLLPEEKVDAVDALQAEYGTVAMVGDGINDAPALATADVGIAMGAAGTDTALETADVALMGDNVGKLPYLYELSHTALGVIRQNVWASLGVKFVLALGVPIGLVSVAVAVVVGDMGMSLGVTGNALRLSRVTPETFD